MKKNTLFKGNTPKAPIEVIRNTEGKIVDARKVQHVRKVGNKQYVYHPTKGWKVVNQYHTHSLLNKLFMDSGYGTIYSDKVLNKAYGW